jgi:hypothetical protein
MADLQEDFPFQFTGLSKEGGPGITLQQVKFHLWRKHFKTFG